MKRDAEVFLLKWEHKNLEAIDYATKLWQSQDAKGTQWLFPEEAEIHITHDEQVFLDCNYEMFTTQKAISRYYRVFSSIINYLIYL